MALTPYEHFIIYKKGGEKNEDDDCIVLTSKNVILRLLSKDPNKEEKLVYYDNMKYFIFLSEAHLIKIIFMFFFYDEMRYKNFMKLAIKIYFWIIEKKNRNNYYISFEEG